MTDKVNGGVQAGEHGVRTVVAAGGDGQELPLPRLLGLAALVHLVAAVAAVVDFLQREEHIERCRVESWTLDLEPFMES